MENEVLAIYKLLKNCQIKMEPGLTIDEISELEVLYSVSFPEDWKNLFGKCLPVSKGFYNWRDKSSENVSQIKKLMDDPIEYILECVDEIEWNDEWGECPHSLEEKKKNFSEFVHKAPVIIPIYSHRYMPAISSGKPPILSINGIDIIYYGKNVIDYFYREFGEEKSIIEIDSVGEVPVWKDLLWL